MLNNQSTINNTNDSMDRV